MEPASATSLAVLQQAIAQGELDPAGKTAVCIMTGHGLKDPDTAVKLATTPQAIPATYEALLPVVLRS